MIIIFIISLLACLAFISWLDIKIFNKKGPREIILTFLNDSVLTLSLSLITLRFLLKKENIFTLTEYSKNLFWLKFDLFTLFIGLFLIFELYLLCKAGIIEKSNSKRTWKSYTMMVISIFLFLLGMIIFSGSKWFIDVFGKLTPEQFIFNFNSPVNGGEDGVVNTIFTTPILLSIVTTIFFAYIFSSNYIIKLGSKFISNKPIRRFGFFVSILMFIVGSAYAVKELQLRQVYKAYFNDSSFIKENYVDPEKTTLKFPENKRNLIHIYLESYENSFFDKENGGYGYEGHNLMPDLMNLSREGVHFSQNDKFGGPHQTYGSSWSVASMVNMSSGLPLKIPMGGNSYGKTGYFLPGATMIGDILKKEGYTQTVMFGADANFGGLTSFFNNHGGFKIFDLKYARNTGLIPKNYKVWWGYEDKKLFEYAKDELIRLSMTGQPFNLTMENADTHFPDGYLEPGSPKPFESPYANVIAHSQKEVVEFVRWIQQQEFYDNTTIVLTGDHLSMDKKYFKDFNSDYERTTYNLILNGDFDVTKIKTTNRDYAPFDMFPTILSSMGVEINGHRLGLGTDLTSNQKTLIENYGLDKVNESLSKNSTFYNNEFVSERSKNINKVTTK